MKLKQASFLLLLIVLVGLIGACTPKESSEEKIVETELKVALAAVPPSLDFQHTTALAALAVGWHMLEPLITVDENYKPVPYLAKSIDISEDGKKITLPLREGVKFHNGKEMTAEDVVASLNRWKNLSGIGKIAMTTTEDIIAEDEYTVSIILSEPSSSVVLALAYPQQGAVIMPKETIEEYGEDAIQEIIGTGPFEFVEWRTDQYIHLKKFKNHQPLDEEPSGLAGRREALVDNLYFVQATDLSSREAGLRSGEYDFAQQLSTDSFNLLKNDENLEMVVAYPSGFLGMNFNLKGEVFDNQEIRQAVNTAIDNEEIMLATQGSQEFFRLDHGLMFKEQAWYVDVASEMYNQNDMEKGKKMLDAAGYNGEEVTILSTRDYEYVYRASIAVKETLEAMGMNVKLEVYDWPTLISRRSDPNAWDIFFTQFPVYIDPSVFLFLDSKAGWPTGYESAEMDALLGEMQNTLDFEEGREKFKKVQELYWKDIPLIRIGEMNSLHAHNKSVNGYKFFMELFFWNVTKE